MAMDGSAAAALTRRPKCPICGRGSEAAFRPFCSKRCADIDLARWLGGHYAIAGREDAEEDESAAPDTLQKRLMDDADDDE